MRGVVGVGLEGEHGDEEEEQQLDGAGDAVDDVILHPLEDAARDDDGVDDHAEAGRSQHEVGRGARGVGRSFDGDADVRLLERLPNMG